MQKRSRTDGSRGGTLDTAVYATVTVTALGAVFGLTAIAMRAGLDTKGIVAVVVATAGAAAHLAHRLLAARRPTSPDTPTRRASGATGPARGRGVTGDRGLPRLRETPSRDR